MATSYDLVSFVTDYGSKGGFVGALHAVVDSITGPERLVRILDLDHSIPPHDVLLGALRMEQTMGYVRRGVHVAVVDPGVGSGRRGVALEAGGRIFVGPDNGLLGFATKAVGGVDRAVALEPRQPARITRTFDGRDVFAPAAAHLACGVDLSELGPVVDACGLVHLPRPVARRLGEGGFELLVVQVDDFGNLQFGAEGRLIEELGTRASFGPGRGAAGELIATVASTFSDVAVGSLVVLVDSDGCVGLSVNKGRADELLGVSRGDLVRCRPIA
ncbi:MAG: SAM hydrolase/SAM-dependent halogenase family protein [Acidimicrobiales bacterium]